MSDTKLSISDLQEVISKSDLELLCTKQMLIEISVIRPSDNASASGLLPKFAVGMHLSPTDEMKEEDEAYSYPAYTEGLFSLDELINMMKAFGIEPTAKVWQVTQNHDAPIVEHQSISDLSQVCLIEE